MDELAEKLDIDPIELRMRNEPTEDPEKHIPYSSRHLIPCMQEGARRFGWERAQSEAGPGRGTAAGWWAWAWRPPRAATRCNCRRPTCGSDPDGVGHGATWR